MQKSISLLSILLTLCGNTSLSAQRHEHRDGEIVELQQFNITASPFALTQQDVVNPTQAIAAAELRRTRQSSLGATLDGQPGIHSTGYAPGAGRPVIRGFDGDRISILQNGTDTFDLSFTSPDHGVAVESLFLDKVEVVRGPASLLYGNAAIGGVVNVIDKSLPREAIEGVTGEAEFQYGSVSEETARGISVQGGQNGFAWSLNYFKRDADDYDIPGYAESAFLRESEEHAHEEEEEHEEGEEHEDEHEEEVFGTLENSFAEADTFAVGAGWFGESASYSLSFSQYDSFYGVPGHAHGHEEEVEQEKNVAIDLRNRRTALRVEWTELGGLFQSAELDAGYGDYQHSELEGEAGAREVGTIFERDGLDLRLSGIHRPIGDWSGAVGVDVKCESFAAIGEEAFIPANDKRNSALFAVERLETAWGALEFGGRIERQSLDPEGPTLDTHSETTYNLSTGLIKRLKNNSSFAAHLSYNERAPNTSELFAFGPHVGTGSFEIGNPALKKEQSLGADLSWRKSAGFLTGELTVFYNDFQDYIFMEHLDEDIFENRYPDADTEGLDILQAEAVDAAFHGFELDLRFHIVDTTDERFHFDLTIDQTRATNRTERTNLPRIPTRRIGGRLGYESGPWNLGLGARHHFKASHLAPEETPTGDYTLVFADITCHLDIGESAIEFFVIGRNLTDEEARPHTSFVKDLVPLPGRNLELGARVLF